MDFIDEQQLHSEKVLEENQLLANAMASLTYASEDGNEPSHELIKAVESLVDLINTDITPNWPQGTEVMWVNAIAGLLASYTVTNQEKVELIHRYIDLISDQIYSEYEWQDVNAWNRLSQEMGIEIASYIQNRVSLAMGPRVLDLLESNDSIELLNIEAERSFEEASFDVTLEWQVYDRIVEIRFADVSFGSSYTEIGLTTQIYSELHFYFADHNFDENDKPYAAKDRSEHTAQFAEAMIDIVTNLPPQTNMELYGGDKRRQRRFRKVFERYIPADNRFWDLMDMGIISMPEIDEPVVA